MLAKRAFSTSRSALQAVVTPAPAVVAPKRPFGFARGSILGFLLGVTAAGTYGYTRLFEEYQSASTLLLVSVEELKASTQKVTEHLKRIEACEREIASLKETTVTGEDLDRVRQEYKQAAKEASIDLLDLKSHLWGVEQDLGSLVKAGQTKISV